MTQGRESVGSLRRARATGVAIFLGTLLAAASALAQGAQIGQINSAAGL